MNKCPVVALILALSLAACSGPGATQAMRAVDVMAPPVVTNPLVVGRVPICVERLNEPQRKRVDRAVRIWNEAIPGLMLRAKTEKCPLIATRVFIDPTMAKRRAGFTICTPTKGCTVTFRSDRHMTECVVVHEIGHLIGMTKHAAPQEEPGPMSDGDRGECLPTAADVALVTRAIWGRPSW